MVRNLFDNAVRYTPAGGQISLSCGSVDGRAFLRIQDTGPGIPVEMREKVFERFFRLPGASASGSGLGLSIVKSIVHSHDAQLELGEAAGQGLIVTIWFSS